MRWRLVPVLLVLATLFFALISQAQAQQSLLPGQLRAPGERPVQQLPEQNPQDQAAQQGQGSISQKQALDLARAKFPGNVISINEVRTRNGVMRYRIRIDSDGNIITVFVDSRTGAVTRE